MERRDKAKVRIEVIAAVFCFACLIFLVRLLVLQVFSRKKYAPNVGERTLVRETVIEAQRGEILDRNGKKLVTNDYGYALALDYYGLPASAREESFCLLRLMALCEKNGCEVNVCDSFPLEGDYPSVRFAAGTEDERKRMTDHYNLRADISAEKLSKYLAKRCGLLEKDALICAPRDALAVMKLRWNMIKSKFYETGEYLLCEKIPEKLMISLKEENMRGAAIKTVSERKYEYPKIASHILGRTGRIYAEDREFYEKEGYDADAIVGVSGCEKVFEKYLRGQNGILVSEYDKNGIKTGEYVKKEAVPGRDVWLTIDIDLQKAAEEGLKGNIDYVHLFAGAENTGEDAAAGAFCMADVRTGEILAMASNPGYDLSSFGEDYGELLKNPHSPLTNRVTDGLYAPGSTFKPLVAYAALKEKVIHADTVIDTKGKYTYFRDYQPRCWIYLQNGTNHGKINVGQAITKSCNYFFYETGRLLGIGKINEYAEKFGLGKDTGFELGGKRGNIAGPASREAKGMPRWKETDTIVAAIGQSENLFSPLQLNMYMAALVNGGTRYRPTILYGVKDFMAGEGEFVLKNKKTPVANIGIDGETRRLLLDAMRGVVTESSSLSYFFAGLPVKVVAKTGTAQVGAKKSENALVMAAAPAENPEVAAVCVIEQGHKGAFSGFTVGRVFKEYFKDYKLRNP